ncbi:hypothetical protein EI555_014350, partial [Monodon monoceros]
VFLFSLLHMFKAMSGQVSSHSYRQLGIRTIGALPSRSSFSPWVVCVRIPHVGKGHSPRPRLQGP